MSGLIVVSVGGDGLTLRAGRLSLFFDCSVPLHADAGMIAPLARGFAAWRLALGQAGR